MTELMKRYEAETGKKAIIALSDTGKNVYRPSYTQWLECRLLKLERSIRGVIDLLNITDVPIPPAPQGE